jgi:NADPH-dependent 2,4-dienoyl-CoA reductase/sulfur reductase-like enzyme
MATGGIPVVPEIKGMERNNVVRMDDLYRSMKDDLEFIEPGIMRGMNRYWDSVGQNVVIIGGTIEGCGLAGFLAERCRNATLVDTDEILGGEPLMHIISHTNQQTAHTSNARVKQIRKRSFHRTLEWFEKGRSVVEINARQCFCHQRIEKLAAVWAAGLIGCLPARVRGRSPPPALFLFHRLHDMASGSSKLRSGVSA